MVPNCSCDATRYCMNPGLRRPKVRNNCVHVRRTRVGSRSSRPICTSEAMGLRISYVNSQRLAMFSSISRSIGIG